MPRAKNLTIELEIPSKSNLTIDVQGVDGEEYISSPFYFLIRATSSDSFDIKDLLGQRAKLTITTEGEELVAWGLLMFVTELDPTPSDLRVLELQLYPRFSTTKLSASNRIFGPDKSEGTTVQDILTPQLQSANVPAEYHFGTLPKRKYVAQYDETNFNFFSRLCERDGVFYYFKHSAQGDAGDTIVFGDDNAAFVPLKDSNGATLKIPYIHPRDYQLASTSNDPMVTTFTSQGVLQTKTVKLRDYNETIPQVVSGSSDAGQTSDYNGEVNVYGGGPLASDTAAGDRARLRAQLIAAGHETFSAETNVPALRAGTIFKLDGHPRLDGEYLVISARHTASRPSPKGFAALPAGGSPYHNFIKCIKADVPFRPYTRTPQPPAVMHVAKVDGSTWSGRAEIDEHGRYKLQMTFADAECGRTYGSDYVRKLEPYVGPNRSGLTFPLIAGTEVIVGYLNGDIDRPVVLGAVYNQSWDNLVNSDQSGNLYNRIKSQSGTLIEIYDGV